METLKKFTTDDELRPWMQNVNIVGKYAYATDGIILVRKLITDNIPQSDIPDIVKNSFDVLFEKFAVKNNIDSDFVLNKLLEYKTEPVYHQYFVDCKECEGSGLVQYVYEYNGSDYTIDGECPACNGNCGSMTNRDKIESYDFITDLRAKFDGMTFKPKYVELILSTFGDIQFGITHQKMFFKSGEYEGLLMECLSNESCIILELTINL